MPRLDVTIEVRDGTCPASITASEVIRRFVGNITGLIYVAGAVEDASFPEEQKNRLEQALTEAGVEHWIKTYPGARHGFAVPDSPSFDPAAERHWTALFKLFHETLPGEL